MMTRTLCCRTRRVLLGMKQVLIHNIQAFTKKVGRVANGSLLTTSCVVLSTMQRSRTNGTLGAAKSQLRSQPIA